MKKFQAAGEIAKPAAPQIKPPVAHAPAEKQKQSKLGYKEARELEELPKRIEALECEQSEITAHFAGGSIFHTNPKRTRQRRDIGLAVR